MKSDELKVVVTEADYKKGKKQFQMVGIGIVVIGLLIATYTLIGILGSTKTLGKVISIEKSYSTSGSGTSRRQTVSYIPTFSFVDEVGDTHQAPTSHSTNSYNYPIGKEVKIYYDLDDLSSVRVNSFLSLWKLPMLFWAVGGFLVWLTTKMNTSVENTRIEKNALFQEEINTKTPMQISQVKGKTDWSEELVDGVANEVRSSSTSKTNIELPKGFEIKFHDSYMHIISRWFDFRVIGILASAVVFNGVWISQGFWSSMMGDKEWFLRLFPLMFIVAGVATAYFALARLLNKTHIYTSKNAIEVKQRPLPWIGNMRIDAVNITQLFSKRSIKSSSNGNTSVTYEVHVITTGNKEIKLISGLAKKEQAWFIENNIEKYLGIEDATVRGEVEE